MSPNDLGPLFERPADPRYLWLFVTLLAGAGALVAAVGLARGRLSRAGVAAGLLALPVFAWVLGFQFLLEESKRVEFCGSCHQTMAPIVAALATDEDSLSSIHWRQGAVDHEQACYQCHSGYGLWGEFAAKRAGFTHMLHTITGGYEFPVRARRFDVNSCLGCHAEAEPFRVAEDHLDRELQDALLSGEMGCTGDCHPQAHPDEALMGAHAAGMDR